MIVSRWDDVAQVEEEEGREESTGRLETKVPTAMLHIYDPFLKGQRQEDLDFHTSLGDKPDPTTKSSRTGYAAQQ